MSNSCEAFRLISRYFSTLLCFRGASNLAEIRLNFGNWFFDSVATNLRLKGC